MDTMETYNSQQCYLDIMHFGVGMVTENDVERAAPFQGGWLSAPNYELYISYQITNIMPIFRPLNLDMKLRYRRIYDCNGMKMRNIFVSYENACIC